MARTRFEHDDRDDYQPPRPRQSSPALVIGLVVGGLMLLGRWSAAGRCCGSACGWNRHNGSVTRPPLHAPIAMPVVKDGVDLLLL